jgi:predicted transposase YbfD/YdcC
VSTTALTGHLDWPGAGQVVEVVRERTIRGAKATEVAYFVTSLSRERADAARLLHLIRRHWGAIENGLHWVRDEVLGEDRSTIRRGHAPQNWAALRNAALNWLRRQGVGPIASTLRSFNRHPARLFARIGQVK